MVTETIPKQQFDFITQVGGTIIGNARNAVNQTLTLYTVPTAKRAYIFSVALSANITTAILSVARIEINDLEILEIAGDTSAFVSQSQVMNFSPPLILDAADVINVVAGNTSVRAAGAFCGVEVDA